MTEVQMPEQVGQDLFMVSDENYEAWSLMLQAAHGLTELTPHSIVRLLRMEATAAALDRRSRVFMGTSGPWLRIEAPKDRPVILTELAAEMVVAGLYRSALLGGALTDGREAMRPDGPNSEAFPCQTAGLHPVSA